MHATDFGNPNHVASLVREIRSIATRPWTLMEVCGGQTHAILRYGIDQLLPKSIRIVHGPGCPVCVTPIETIDRAIQIALQPGVIFCTFGDMLRVPGSYSDLMQARSHGADIRIIQSPMEAYRIALEESINSRSPQTSHAVSAPRQFVLFAIGFETTAPATAMAIRMAKSQHLDRFSALVCHVLVPPALEAIFSDKEHGIDGLLAAGHVCTIAGYRQYESIASRFGMPIAITGFEPVDLLRGILEVIAQLETKQSDYRVANVYEHIASPDGNIHAQRIVEEVFERCDQPWRGFGVLPQSGLKLYSDFAHHDAQTRFPTAAVPTVESSMCRAADVLRGKIRPIECPAFGKQCNPNNPLGAPMVSNEGACAAYYLYQSLHSIGKLQSQVQP
jgi:hydrogenase expression/formation protein HypD